MRRKDQSPTNFYKNSMCAQKHTSLFKWQNPSFFQPFSLPVQMLGSLSKAIKACQGFKEGNWRWLKWKVRMWGQCWNSLNGRPVSGWSIMDSVLKALGLIHLNIREDWIHQRTSQCNSKSSLCIWKRSLYCRSENLKQFVNFLQCCDFSAIWGKLVASSTPLEH